MCLAVPGKIVQIEELAFPHRKGKINFEGILKEVNLSYVPEAKIGDYVIVHVGFAISILDEKEARRVFEYLKLMNEIKELEA